MKNTWIFLAFAALSIFLAACAQQPPAATPTPFAQPTLNALETTSTPVAGIATPTSLPTPRPTEYVPQNSQATAAPSGELPYAEDKTITITAGGFSPSAIRIKSGETITFINGDSKPHWPASGAHPTHELYPEKGGCIASKFDACKALAPGETWPFKFRFNGIWKYHDHLNPDTTGIIQVG